MRNLKFTVSALAILLAGAMAAGFAARAVAAPRAGETVSAGVVSVPSVLGQLAEEALFYPWPQYDEKALQPIPQDILDEMARGGTWLSAVYALDQLGAEVDWDDLLKHQLWDQPNDKPTHMTFLKDYPAVLAEDKTPVTLSYALNGYPPTLSWLLRPAEEVELTGEQRQAALDKVEGDLAELLWYYCRPERNYKLNDLMIFLTGFQARMRELDLVEFPDRFQLLMEWIYGRLESPPEDQTEIPGATGVVEEQDDPLPLEELVGKIEAGGGSVQLLSTPGQVVMLISGNADTLGVYYDIQLERYSGVGFSLIG